MSLKPHGRDSFITSNATPDFTITQQITWAPRVFAQKNSSWPLLALKGSTALGVAAVEAGHAAIFLHQRLAVALVAERRTGGKTTPSLLLVGFLRGLDLRLLAGQKRLLVLIQPGHLEHADLGEVGLDHVANFGDKGRNVLAFVPVAALGIEHGAQLLHQKGNITPLRNTAEMMRVSATIHW